MMPSGSPERLSLCRESRPWLRDALPVYRALEAEGKVKFVELDNRAIMEKAWSQCDGLVAGAEPPY
jgi:hypothetical protein